MSSLHQYEKDHIAVLRKLSPECMVLLKSDGSFPLEEAGKIALYGSGARKTLKGGTGSGDVNVRHFATVEEGLGKAYPSGKLAATWGGEKTELIGDFAKEDDTRYREGIYVGYRYFDSVGAEPLFPFGYGLGYTAFSSEVRDVCIDGTDVAVRAEVKNIGNASGKEILLLYVSVPWGKLDQPYQTLAAFAKTDELKAGEAQEVVLSFSMEDLASFDTGKSAEILEPGDYILRIGNSSRNTEACAVVRMDEEAVLAHLDHAGGEADFADWKPEYAAFRHEEEKAKIEEKARDGKIFLASLDNDVWRIKGTPENGPEPGGETEDEELRKLLETLRDDELAYLCVGRYQEKGSESVIGNAGFAVAGSAGETARLYEGTGIPGLVMADGPAGLRLSRRYGKDERGVYAVDLVGREMERFGVNLWLAPALNIQRSPLCGRNFEYYSEDPLVSGKIAAAITRGVQRHPGCGVTVKHFACNNQETNRFRSNSIVSERALRDIYLRGFRIAIQEAQPYALMTSYNLINGEHTSQRADLIQQVLRKEWGFEGIVMSDWVTSGIPTGRVHKYPLACASGSIRAGNDIMMPGGQADHDDLINAITDSGHPYPLTREQLKECAYRIARMARKLGRKAAPAG